MSIRRFQIFKIPKPRIGTLRTILCWSVAIRFFNTFSLKVIYVRFVHLGYTVRKRMPNIKIITKKYKASVYDFVCLLFKIENMICKKCLIKRPNLFFGFSWGMYIVINSLYKQGKFAINAHQIHIFIISNCLVVLTENLRYLYIALNFVAHWSISQNRSSLSNI